MNINVTLIGQMISFGLFVFFCMKFVWPPLISAIEERQKRIADGLAAADRGKHDLELAQERATEVLREARTQASEIIEQANKRAAQIVEDAKDDAVSEAERIRESARHDVEQQAARAREELRGKVVSIAVAGAEKIIERNIDETDQAKMLDKVIAEL